MAIPRSVKIVGRFVQAPCLRLLIAFVVLVFVCVPSVYIVNTPPQEYDYNSMTIDYSKPFDPNATFLRSEPDFEYNVLIDVHSHTDVGGAQMSPETALQWHIACGYNAVVITDHNDISRAKVAQQIAREKYNDKIKVIIGEEWSNCRMHMGLIGINEFIDVPKNPTDEQIQDVINKTHAQGGLVIVNHPTWAYWAGLDMPPLENLWAWGVDFFDVTTAELLDLQTYLWAKQHNASIVAATDIHEVNVAHEWTLLNVPGGNITEESIMDALRSKKTSFIFSTIGYYPPTKTSSPPPNEIYTWAYPWILIGRLVHSYFYMTGQGVYSFVDGSCGDESGFKLVVLYKEIAITLLMIVLVWFVFEVVFGFIHFVFEQVKKKLGYSKRRGLSSLNDEYSETPLLEMFNK